MASLSNRQRAFLKALAPRIVPGAAALDAAESEAMLDLIAVALGDRDADVQRQFALFLGVLRWAPLARYGRPLDALTPQQQTDVLRFFEDCPVQLVRCGFWGVRTLVLLGYYGRPAAAAAIHYAPTANGNAVLHDRARS